MTKRVDFYFVAAGKYHDIDFARLEVLKLLAEHPCVRTHVASDYSDIDAIKNCAVLITYTCDLMPTEQQQQGLDEFMQGGGKWFALHGTNSILQLSQGADGGIAQVNCPTDVADGGAPKLMEIVGSQFLAHPPIAPYTVTVADPEHPLVIGIEPFQAEDELYLSAYHGDHKVLLETDYDGSDVNEFVHSKWAAQKHMVFYIHPYANGEVLYLTLGHCRGHYDMAAAGMDYYPVVEKGSWELPEYYELLRRGIKWCLGEIS